MSSRTSKPKTKHIDVMLSSTSRDLPAYRKEAIDAVWRAKMFPVAMETLSAEDKDAIKTSLDMVDTAEIYVGIFAHRYGYIPDDPIRNPDRLSVTELEYQRAKKRGIPILIYMMKDDYKLSVAADELDIYFESSDEGKTKLKALKNRLLTDHVVGFFETAKDLRALLIQSLYDPDTIEKAAEVAGELDDYVEDVIPRPPLLYSVPPYIQTGAFVGRASELAWLDTWSSSDDPVMIVEAIGGQGKSALTWHWVQDRAVGFEGMMWWSFYERGANMSAFMRHAIAYIESGDPDDPKYRNMPHDERKTRLLALLQSNHVLIVLDGLERILTAYHRLDKAQVRDDQVESDLRSCIDPKDTDILYQLVGSNPSKILVSTRLVPRVLEDYDGEVINGVSHKKLDGLAPKDAETMFIEDNVRFNNKRQLHDFLNQFGYHGLLLKMVIGRIKKDRRARGDFDKWYDQRGKTFDFTQLDIKQRRTTILQFAMEGLDDAAKMLLSRVAAFDDGVNFDTLEVVANTFDSLDDFDKALDELEDRGLLQWERETDTYDLHPVVRGFAFANLQGDERVNTFNRIHDHFESQEYSYDDVTDVEQLQIPIAIYRALVGAGRLDDAASFYRRGCGRALFYYLIAYPTIIQLLKPLFAEGLYKPPQLRSTIHQSYFLNHLALVFEYSGESLSALQLLTEALKIDFNTRKPDDLTIGLANYGDVAGEANQLYRQFRAYTLRHLFAQTKSRHIHRSYQALYRSHMIRGNTKGTDIALRKLGKFTYNSDGMFEIFRVQMLLGQSKDPSNMLSKGLGLAKAHPFMRAIMEAYGFYILHYIQQNDLKQAMHFAEEAIKLARRSGHYALAQYLGRWARVRAKQGQFDEALSLIAEAWRGNVVKFDEAELYNCAAYVYRDMGNTAKATENAINAYKIAWADGPPYANYWQLEQAKAHLDALEVEYPYMPPFDESKMEKLPYEDELRAYLEELRQEKEAEESQDDD